MRPSGNNIVGVHGIAKQQLGRHQLREPWRRALADGLERAAGRPLGLPPLDIAYYGDLCLPSSNGQMKTFDQADWILSDVTSDELDMLTASLAEMAIPMPPSDDPERLKGYTRSPLPLQVALRAMDRRFGGTAGSLCLGELRQVRRYLREPEIGASARHRVGEMVDGRCRVLIGHSLGSVVALDYLLHHPGSGVEVLITLGSPLGLSFIRHGLGQADAAAPAPLDGVTWINVRDPRDPVACTSLLAHWPGIAELAVDNQTDAHAVERYLGKRETGEAVLTALPQLATLGMTP